MQPLGFFCLVSPARVALTPLQQFIIAPTEWDSGGEGGRGGKKNITFVFSDRQFLLSLSVIDHLWRGPPPPLGRTCSDSQHLQSLSATVWCYSFYNSLQMVQSDWVYIDV